MPGTPRENALAGETNWTFSQKVTGSDTLQATVSGLVGGTAYEFGVLAVTTDGQVGGIGIAASTPLVLPATFRVTKAYSDSTTTPVTVTMSCNGGIPLTQSFDISPGNPVTFTLSDFISGSVVCEVTETYPPTNYTPSYNNGTSVSATSCLYDPVTSGGSNSCVISNTAGNATYTVNKQWVLDPDLIYSVELVADVTISCTSEILESDAQEVNGEWLVERQLVGESESTTVMIDTTSGAAVCGATEQPLPGYVDVDNGCVDSPVSSDENVDCTITNTLFFEGVPTLNRFGMVVLSLLVLGFGLLVQRRT